MSCFLQGILFSDKTKVKVYPSAISHGRIKNSDNPSVLRQHRTPTSEFSFGRCCASHCPALSRHRADNIAPRQVERSLVAAAEGMAAQCRCRGASPLCPPIPSPAACRAGVAPWRSRRRRHDKKHRHALGQLFLAPPHQPEPLAYARAATPHRLCPAARAMPPQRDEPRAPFLGFARQLHHEPSPAARPRDAQLRKRTAKEQFIAWEKR